MMIFAEIFIWVNIPYGCVWPLTAVMPAEHFSLWIWIRAISPVCPFQNSWTHRRLSVQPDLMRLALAKHFAGVDSIRGISDFLHSLITSQVILWLIAKKERSMFLDDMSDFRWHVFNFIHIWCTYCTVTVKFGVGKMTLFEMSLLWVRVRGKGRARSNNVIFALKMT